MVNMCSLKTRDTEDPRPPLLRHFLEDIPDIEVGEISTALEQLKNGRATKNGAVIFELLKAAG